MRSATGANSDVLDWVAWDVSAWRGRDARIEVVDERASGDWGHVLVDHTFAAGLDGPEGVYGFVGDGIRSDFQPLNGGSGLALGNPTNLNFAGGQPFAPDFNQHPGHFQAYSHYVMPGGLVQSFIDTIGTHDNFVRGGTLGPTVKLDLDGASSSVDYSYGTAGLGGWADIPANKHLFTTGKHGIVASDEAVAKIRAVVGAKLDDYLQAKPVPAPVKALIEKLIAQYGG